MFQRDSVNSSCVFVAKNLVMGIGQAMKRKADNEFIISLKESLRQSHHNCLLCTRVSDHYEGQPICKTCHIFLVYSQDYYDTFLCKCNPQLISETNNCHHSHALHLGGDKDEIAIANLLFGHNGPHPNWPFPSKLIQNLTNDDLQENYESNDMTNCFSLPPEIICMIFKNLDDISLLTASKTCKNWNILAKTLYPDRKWESLVLKRWPLFRRSSGHPSVSWFSVYFKMLQSVPCVECLLNSTGDSKLPEPNYDNDCDRDGSCSRLKRLDQEFASISAVNIKGIDAIPLDSKKYNWITRLIGPSNSPYDGGIFYINFKFPINYPFQPPKIRFFTKIFHPDISRHGDLNVLDLIDPRFWTPGHTIRSLLISIQSILIQPHLRSNVEPLIKKMYTQNKTVYEEIAMKWTAKYAINYENLV